MPTAESTARIRRWLATSDPDPDHALRWWGAGQAALVPVGRIWDVIKVVGVAGEAALAAGLEGPAIRDHDAVYLLVPTGSAAAWSPLPGVDALGSCAYLTVPAPDQVTPPGVHWCQLPPAPGRLVDPAALHDVLTQLAVPGALR